MNKNTAGPAEPIYDSRNSDEPPRMRIRCENHDYYLKPDGCPMCRALKAEAELDSLRQENSRLREALATWLKWWDHEVPGTEKGRIYRWTEELLNPPKS